MKKKYLGWVGIVVSLGLFAWQLQGTGFRVPTERQIETQWLGASNSGMGVAAFCSYNPSHFEPGYQFMCVEKTGTGAIDQKITFTVLNSRKNNWAWFITSASYINCSFSFGAQDSWCSMEPEIRVIHIN